MNKKSKFLSLVMLMTLLVFSPATTYSEDLAGDTQMIFSDDMEVDQIAELYHTKMNEFFNKKAALLVKGEGADTVAPENHEECLKKDNNISTFCVAIQASNLYLKFRDALYARWDKIDTDKDSSLQGLLEKTANRRQFIEDQATRSKAALDLTLSAYNELRWSYSLHKEYKNIIKDLLPYRDRVADVRSYVEEYPSRFQDATTPYCK